MAALLAFPAAAAAQDPFWKVIRPTVAWEDGWATEPRPPAVHAVLDEPSYRDQRPADVTGDRAFANRRGQRFEIGFSDIAPGVERFSGGEAWVYVGIQKGTRVDFALRTRRANGRVEVISNRNRVTPPITLQPELPPVGVNGFRDWLPLSVPALTRQEANHLSLAVRISPSSPRRSLSRAYAAFAELYPEGS